MGIEDVILGFVSSGVCASLYLVLFRKKIIEKVNFKLKRKILNLSIIILLHVSIFILLFTHGINSFWCTLLTMFSASLFLLFKKRHLYVPAFINGLLMVLLVTPIYFIMTSLTPHLVEQTWMTNNLLGIYFLKIPIEDYIFYFLSGILCFAAYPFLKDGVIKNLK